jgi:hypothetical protein
MPFLARKDGVSEINVSMRHVLGEATAAAWEEDEYRPSGRMPGFDGLGLSTSLAQGPQKTLCGNLECANGWTKPWRNRRRPIFEDQWGCSGRCVLAMARAAIRRELGDRTAETAASTPHRHRIPLGLLMLSQGWITHPQLRRALEAQRENGVGRIGDWLQSECGVEARQITRGLSMQWNCPVLTTDGFAPEVMALAVPRLFVEKFALLPLRVAGARILYLGFDDRLDATSAFALEKMTQLKVESGLVEGAQFQAARSRLLECRGVETRLETVGDEDVLAARMTAILEQKKPLASRLVRMHQYYWMRIWLESGAIGKVGNLPRTGEDVTDHIFTIGT